MENSGLYQMQGYIVHNSRGHHWHHSLWKFHLLVSYTGASARLHLSLLVDWASQTLALASVFKLCNSSWLLHFLVNWLWPTIFEFLRFLADSWHHRFTITQTRCKSCWSSLAVLSFVSDPLAEVPLNQARANIKRLISGLQRSLGSGRFIEHQINYLAKQVELLWLRGRLQQHTFTLLPQR